MLGVGGAYLQVVAARARVTAGQAQLETANALFQQTDQRRSVGLVAQVDVGRSQVQALTQQQRLTSLQNDFAKQKINLARMIGLPPTDQYEIGDDIPFAPAPPLPLEDALQQALDRPRRSQGGGGAGPRRGARPRRRARRPPALGDRQRRLRRDRRHLAGCARHLFDRRQRSRADLAGRLRRGRDSAGRSRGAPAPRRARGLEQPDRGRRAEGLSRPRGRREPGRASPCRTRTWRGRRST